MSYVFFDALLPLLDISCLLTALSGAALKIKRNIPKEYRVNLYSGTVVLYISLLDYLFVDCVLLISVIIYIEADFESTNEINVVF